MKIYVIRHGLTELNKQKILNAQIDEELAPEGLEQAKIASSLIPKSVTHIYSSPLHRARQTAKIINSKLQLPISWHDALTEINMGSLAGQSWSTMDAGEDLKEKHRSIKFDYRPLGGESAADVRKRVVKFLKKISANHSDHEVLIITHGGIIRLLHLLAHGTHQLDELENASLLLFDFSKVVKNSKKDW